MFKLKNDYEFSKNFVVAIRNCLETLKVTFYASENLFCGSFMAKWHLLFVTSNQHDLLLTYMISITSHGEMEK